MDSVGWTVERSFVLGEGLFSTHVNYSPSKLELLAEDLARTFGCELGEGASTFQRADGESLGFTRQSDSRHFDEYPYSVATGINVEGYAVDVSYERLLASKFDHDVRRQCQQKDLDNPSEVERMIGVLDSEGRTYSQSLRLGLSFTLPVPEGGRARRLNHSWICKDLGFPADVEHPDFQKAYRQLIVPMGDEGSSALIGATANYLRSRSIAHVQPSPALGSFLFPEGGGPNMRDYLATMFPQVNGPVTSHLGR